MFALLARASSATRAPLAFLFALACASAPSAALAQASVVSGTVTAADGTPIDGARVSLSQRSHRYETTSDASGKFWLTNVPSGTYSVAAFAPGYAPVVGRTVTVAPYRSVLVLVLSRATTNSLTVIGTVRSASGESASTASAPSVSLSPQAAAAAGTTAVSDMLWNQLATTPVLPLGGGSNATVSYAVRGPDPTETLVDIDGHQVNNGNTGDFDLSLLDPAALQEVQVVYGIAPSSLVGPNTLGGAINIVTLEPTTTPHAFIRGFGGSFGSFGETFQTTGTVDKVGYALSLHRATSSGEVNLDDVGSAYFGQSLLSKLRYQLGTGYGYLQLSFKDQSTLKDLSALLSSPGSSSASHQANYGFDAQLPLDGANGAVPTTMMQFSHLTTLASQSVAGPATDTTPYLFNQRDLIGDDWIRFDHRFAAGDLSLKADLLTESLATGNNPCIAVDQIVAAVTPIAMDDTGGGCPPVATPVALSQTQRSAVLRYDGNPSTHIHYSLAGYYSNFSTFGTSFDPRAGFVWSPTSNTSLRASLGTTFQAPQLSELYRSPTLPPPVNGVIYTGNPTLQPDHATEYDLGMQQLFGGFGHQTNLSLDLYRTNVRSQSTRLVPDPIPGCGQKGHPACPISMPVNGGDAIYTGIDVSAEQQFGREYRLRAGWDVDSSYGTSIPANLAADTPTLGEQYLGQPLHKAYLTFERDVPHGFVFGTTLAYEGTYNELNRGPYATLAAHVAYRAKDYEFGLYGTNLTNANDALFTIPGGGIIYDNGSGPANTDAYALQGTRIVLVVTKTI